MNPLNQISPATTLSHGTVSPAPARTLAQVLDSLSPLPASSIFMGLAEDGLPVLFNLRDSSPGPVLIAADAGAGKTRLLQTVARGIERFHNAADVRYAVVTEHPGEWRLFEHSRHCERVLAFHQAFTTGYLHCAALGQPSDIRSSTSLILLIDGFEALVSDGDLRDSAHALLRSPTPRGVFPLVTLNTSTAAFPDRWLDAFTARLFGYIRDQPTAASLCGSVDNCAGDLQPPAQFSVRERGSWLQFWLPDLD
jgi:hypothetical protein